MHQQNRDMTVLLLSDITHQRMDCSQLIRVCLLGTNVLMCIYGPRPQSGRSVGDLMCSLMPLTGAGRTSSAATAGIEAAPARPAGLPGPPRLLLVPVGLRAAVYPLYARSRSAFGEADQRRGSGAAEEPKSGSTATTGRRASAAWRRAKDRSASAVRAGSRGHTHAGSRPIASASIILAPPTSPHEVYRARVTQPSVHRMPSLITLQSRYSACVAVIETCS